MKFLIWLSFVSNSHIFIMNIHLAAVIFYFLLYHHLHLVFLSPSLFLFLSLSVSLKTFLCQIKLLLNTQMFSMPSYGFLKLYILMMELPHIIHVNQSGYMIAIPLHCHESLWLTFCLINLELPWNKYEDRWGYNQI